LSSYTLNFEGLWTKILLT